MGLKEKDRLAIRRSFLLKVQGDFLKGLGVRWTGKILKRKIKNTKMCLKK